jgi:hypothetical protein
MAFTMRSSGMFNQVFSVKAQTLICLTCGHVKPCNVQRNKLLALCGSRQKIPHPYPSPNGRGVRSKKELLCFAYPRFSSMVGFSHCLHLMGNDHHVGESADFLARLSKR